MMDIIFFRQTTCSNYATKGAIFLPFCLMEQMILKSDGSQVRATHIHDAMIDYDVMPPVR